MYVSEFQNLVFDLFDDTKTPFHPIMVTPLAQRQGACVTGRMNNDTWYASGILFNENYVKAIDKRQATYCILHEIAHLHTFPMHRNSEIRLDPHGPAWVAECRKLGIKAHRRMRRWPGEQ